MKIETSSIGKNWPNKTVVPLSKDEIEKVWAESEPCQKTFNAFWETLTRNISKTREFNLQRKLPGSLLSHILSWNTNIWSPYILYWCKYIGKAAFKSENLSKIDLSSYDIVQK